jgi:hypothetical protein
MENFFFRRGGTREPMPRCQNDKCGAALIYEPEFLDTPARWICMAFGWMRTIQISENNPGIFLRNQWIGRSAEKEHPGYDLYCPRSAAAQLHISGSFFRESVKKDPKAPVIPGRGMIACNTSALREWWDEKRHHKVFV